MKVRYISTLDDLSSISNGKDNGSVNSYKPGYVLVSALLSLLHPLRLITVINSKKIL